MAWFWRFFRAPGNENIPLPVENSSWNTGRVVQMLDGHMETIMQFISELDSEKAIILENIVDLSDSEGFRVKMDDLRDMVDFIEYAVKMIRSSDVKQLIPSENDPDAFEKDIYADMLDAVKAIFEESIRLDQPFRSWVEYT